ncbi:hypothetical protein AN1V17_07830 [Vallitalea sediminicola]
MKNKNRPRRYRLKVEFIIALIISIIIATFGVVIIMELQDTYINNTFNNKYDKARNELSIVFDELEKYIIDNNIDEKSINELYAELEKYPKYNLYTEVFDKNDIWVFLDQEYSDNAWPILFTQYVKTDNNIFVLNGNLKSLDDFFNIISIIIPIIFIIIFIMVLSFFIGRKQKYLINVANSLDILEGGDLNHQVSIKGNDEITYVARHINQMSSALKKRIEKEKFIEQSKNELIANISHDLRTPLTSITGYLTLLKDDYEKNEYVKQKYLDICLNKSTALSNLIEQLFEYVMLANGQMKLNLVNINIATYIRQSIYEWETLLEEHNMEIYFHIEESDKDIAIDIDKFNRVIENLFKNLLKYADKDKKVELTARWIEDKYYIQLSNGIKEGVNLSESDVFNRFFTSDRTLESGGIGLAICKEIITMHKGEIDAVIDQDRFTIKIIL